MTDFQLTNAQCDDLRRGHTIYTTNGRRSLSDGKIHLIEVLDSADSGKSCQANRSCSDCDVIRHHEVIGKESAHPIVQIVRSCVRAIDDLVYAIFGCPDCCDRGDFGN